MLTCPPGAHRREQHILAGLAQPQGSMTTVSLIGNLFDPASIHHDLEISRQGGTIDVIGAADFSAR